MPKYAYLREDGRYDTYDVEPTVITAEEYAVIKKREELQAREAQLLVQRASIDAEIADVRNKLASTAEPAGDVALNTSNAETSGNGKRRW